MGLSYVVYKKIIALFRFNGMSMSFRETKLVVVLNLKILVTDLIAGRKLTGL